MILVPDVDLDVEALEMTSCTEIKLSYQNCAFFLRVMSECSVGDSRLLAKTTRHGFQDKAYREGRA